MRPRTFDSRRAFTLIELLVVIALILVLATLSVLILPRLGDDQRAVRAADHLSMWILIAKQRANRDQAPRGVRLVPSADDPSQVRELVYTERPEDVRGGEIQIQTSVPPPTPGPPAIDAALVPGYDPRSVVFIPSKDLTNGNIAVTLGNWANVVNPTVEPGDFLVMTSLENIPYNVHRIAALYYVAPSAQAPNGGTYMVLATADGKRSQINKDQPAVVNDSTGNAYRILRRQRPLVGESVLQLPKDMIIDISPDPVDANGGKQGFSDFPGKSSGNYDFVFNQRGELMGDNSVNGKVILRVRNATKPLDGPDQLLVVIYARTGLIAVQPLDMTPSASGAPGYYADPFSFTKDGKASGL